MFGRSHDCVRVHASSCTETECLGVYVRLCVCVCVKSQKGKHKFKVSMYKFASFLIPNKQLNKLMVLGNTGTSTSVGAEHFFFVVGNGQNCFLLIIAQLPVAVFQLNISVSLEMSNIAILARIERVSKTVLVCNCFFIVFHQPDH